MNLKEKAMSAAVQGGVATAQAVGAVMLSAETALKLNQATSDAAFIATSSKQLPGKIGRIVAEIAITAQEIVNEVRNDPRDFQVIRSFFDYNLAKARDVIEARVKLVDESEEKLAAIDEVIGDIKTNFDNMYKKCQENDVSGAEVAAEALSRIMKANI